MSNTAVKRKKQKETYGRFFRFFPTGAGGEFEIRHCRMFFERKKIAQEGRAAQRKTEKKKKKHHDAKKRKHIREVSY